MKIPGFYTIYIALLIAAATMTVIAFFTGNVIDIHTHDTMFVISTAHISGLFFLFFSILYLANRRLVRRGRANLFLWIVLVITWLMWVATAYFDLESSPASTKFLDVTSFQSYTTYWRWVNKIATGIAVVFIFFQLAFWVYFIVRVASGLVKKKSPRSV